MVFLYFKPRFGNSVTDDLLWLDMLHQFCTHYMYIGPVYDLFCFLNEAVREKALFIALEFTLANS